QKNRSSRLGAGVTKEVTTRHTSDGGVDGRQYRIVTCPVKCKVFGPFCLMATAKTMNHQTGDGLSPRPSDA
ncbi:hypothetical protein HAX54_005777, partial [Datura stramonium]|nr:hypothetical protein [Datura stramonium]